jgi:tRNA threonylcarbamoyl adenosine modification protein YeaZ
MGDRHQVWPLGRDLTTYLHPTLIQFLAPHAWSDLSFLAVAQGPGGFTGTRIGVVVARTLAQQLDIPLFGISSLGAIAQTHYLSQQAIPRNDAPGNPFQSNNAPRNPVSINPPPPAVHLAIQMPAQRGELFGAIYEPTPKGLIPHLGDQVLTQADWEQILAEWPAPLQVISATGGLAHTVVGVMDLARQSWLAGQRPLWSEVLPFYGQHPVEGSG